MKWAVVTLAIMFWPLLLLAPLIGYLIQPFGPWYVGQRAPAPNAPPLDVGSLPVSVQPQISDIERYTFAAAAGFSAAEAITATAISIAENGSGNPAALSVPNKDGSRDLGLWQINSGWWARFGGAESLVDPARNARAAYAIYQRQGWCGWSTYDANCGAGHTGSWAAFRSRAELAANSTKHQ